MILFIFEGKKNRTKEIREPLTEEKLTLVLNNLNTLKEQNIKKANFICNDIFDYPESKDDINQLLASGENNLHESGEINQKKSKEKSHYQF